MIEQAKHTPGPLGITRSREGDVAIVSAGGHIVAECFASIRRADEDARAEAEANARLYAAAPDLLKACRQAIVALRGREHDGFLRDAIAHATGATP